MKKRRILLVDDEAIVRDSISEWLSDDYEIECACDGNEAISKVRTSRFDTTVLDLKMPGMDGMEVMRRMQQASPQIHVIIITAYGTTETAVEAMKSGASDYLTKPFTMDKLEQSLQEVFRRRKAVVIPPEPATESLSVAPTPEKAKLEKPCIWAKAGIIAYRACGHNFKCGDCDFARTLMDKGAQTGDRPMQMDAIRKMLRKPGPERACRYMLSGQATYRLCSNVYRCGQCDFHDYMEEKLDADTAKMTAKLKTMHERKSLGRAPTAVGI